MQRLQRTVGAEFDDGLDTEESADKRERKSNFGEKDANYLVDVGTIELIQFHANRVWTDAESNCAASKRFEAESNFSQLRPLWRTALAASRQH